MDDLIGITHAMWAAIPGRDPAQGELERYARHEFGDTGEAWLRSRPPGNHVVLEVGEGDPRREGRCWGESAA